MIYVVIPVITEKNEKLISSLDNADLPARLYVDSGVSWHGNPTEGAVMFEWRQIQNLSSIELSAEQYHLDARISDLP